jgi:uncharacterized protein involved in exopolysaccharide biosynthesis
MTNFGATLTSMLRNWRLFAISSALGLAIGIAQVSLTDQMFRADVSLSPVDQSTPLLSQVGSALGLAGLTGIVPGLGGGDRDTEQMLALFGSREFALKFIQQYDLAPEMFPDRWSPGTRTWKSGRSVIPWAKGPSQPTRRELLQKFSELRTIGYDKQTGVVHVRLEWSSPKRAEQLLAQLVRDFNDFSRVRAKAEADSAIAFLRQELAKTDVTELRQALSRVMQQQMTRIMMATVQQEYALRTIDRSAASEKPARPRYLVTPVLWVLAALVLALGWVTIRGRGTSLP